MLRHYRLTEVWCGLGKSERLARVSGSPVRYVNYIHLQLHSNVVQFIAVLSCVLLYLSIVCVTTYALQTAASNRCPPIDA